LWTGDKTLIGELKKKEFNRLITTEELFADFINKEKLKKCTSQSFFPIKPQRAIR
jgi:hypothetical protein